MVMLRERGPCGLEDLGLGSLVMFRQAGRTSEQPKALSPVQSADMFLFPILAGLSYTTMLLPAVADTHLSSLCYKMILYSVC